MTEHYINETLEHIKTALKDAGLDKSEIQLSWLEVQLDFQKLTKWWDFFGKDLNKGVNPDEVVAAGAAVQAGVLKRWC